MMFQVQSRFMLVCGAGTHSLNGGSKLASEDEAVNALLQARNVHDLCKVALHCAQLLGITQALVLWMLSLQQGPTMRPSLALHSPALSHVGVLDILHSEQAVRGRKHCQEGQELTVSGNILGKQQLRAA